MPPKVSAKKTNKGTEKAAADSKAKSDKKKSDHEAKKSVCSAYSLAMPNPPTYKQHFESKHPKLPLPEELK